MPAATKAKPKTEPQAAAKEKVSDNAVTKAAGGIFAKIKSKTGVSQEKIDKWQEGWLAMPKTRKKYEHLKDTPQIIGEELIAMSNDIIDFIQGQEGGKSHILTKLKANLGGIFHNPSAFIKGKVAQGKELAQKAKAQAGAIAEKGQALSQKGMSAAKAGVEKAQAGAKEAKKMTDKAKAGTGKAKAVASQTKKAVGKAKKAVKKKKA